ncbi:hypothetical protein IVB22_09115 [Bradyrhizobium sp. 190]|uniref:hypothetical protein n=1 Tax=Bradyrhizobium sp. 190 TaxID=2782658 RepID=UPI001FF9A520|nr:hypothetical protein [Bradyrhizobium sp. 190]MCK1512732.1 hypothetical protein [Bradyrhizobium sp. 190]
MTFGGPTAPLPHFGFTPMADIDHHQIDVRFVPNPEVSVALDDLVSTANLRKWHRQNQRSG